MTNAIISSVAKLVAEAHGCSRRFTDLTAVTEAADVKTVILAIKIVWM